MLRLQTRWPPRREFEVPRRRDLDPWVRWFAQVVRDAGDATANFVSEIGELEARWMHRLTDMRADAAARRMVALLPQHPVLAADIAAAALGVSDRTCRCALAKLAEHGIVQPFGPKGGGGMGRPRNLWGAGELVDLVSAWSG